MRTVLLIVTVATVAGLVGAPSAGAATYRACEPVKNPYAGTRYDGVDLSRIRALRTSCHGARHVAKGAHRKALGLAPPANGIRRFTWRGWSVTGDLRPSSDRYVARKGRRRVRWRF